MKGGDQYNFNTVFIEETKISYTKRLFLHLWFLIVYKQIIT